MAQGESPCALRPEGGWALPPTAEGRSLAAERCRSLSGPSRKRPKLCPRLPREAPEIPERLPPGRESLRRDSPKLPELPHPLGLRKEPKFPERGGHGRCRAERGGRGGTRGGERVRPRRSPEEAEVSRTLLASERLRKEPKVAERRWAERLRSGPKAPERPSCRTAGGGRSAMFDAPLLQ